MKLDTCMVPYQCPAMLILAPCRTKALGKIVWQCECESRQKMTVSMSNTNTRLHAIECASLASALLDSTTVTVLDT